MHSFPLFPFHWRPDSWDGPGSLLSVTSACRIHTRLPRISQARSIVLTRLANGIPTRTTLFTPNNLETQTISI